MVYDNGMDMYEIFGIAISPELEVIWEGTKSKPCNVCEDHIKKIQMKD